jgi:uncharacterized protein
MIFRRIRLLNKDLNVNSIFTLLRSHKSTLQMYGVARIGVFGSFARNAQTSHSDIDFLVDFDKGKKNFDNLMDLYFFLQDLFTPRIDLLTIEGISPFMKPYIENEVIYERL